MKDSNFHKFLKDKGENPPEIIDAFQVLLEQQEKIICDLFLAAVNDFDGQKILEIAEAVWFLKGHIKGGFKDVERGELFWAKLLLNREGKKWTIRQVAEHLAGGKKVETPADGWKSLRDKCRAMDFPLDEKRKIRRK